MDAADHYRQLIKLGRDEFLAAAAPAALVRLRGEAESNDPAYSDGSIDETLPIGSFSITDIDMEIHPLLKRAGAAHGDRITIGRTSNNDVAIPDHSISRLHAYVRRHGTRWVVADAGSKNGSWLRGEALEPRKEREVHSREIIRLGDVDLTFYLAADLFQVLGGLS